MPFSHRRLLMPAAAIAERIHSLAERILADAHCADSPLVLIGIHNRGVPFAQRLARAMHSLSGKEIPVGTLDITQYRDDLGTLSQVPQLIGSDIPFDIDSARVVLCDEVIYTGRSIRAALGELLDFGRPACVQLAVLIDRGGREFPIQPDYSAETVQIADNQRVSVQFTEVDAEDAVYIESPTAP
jgi:pyrimidine operon attenuation protein / uracil phosphoribosyltransferase